MPVNQPLQLSPTEETLLVPLFARAAESRRKRGILKDPKALEMVAGIPWDYERINQRWRLRGVVMRTAMFDEWVRAFLQRNPEGTVVEIGTGLNTRFERLDNGKVHWFDLDLPAVIELRRRYFSDSERRTMLAASIIDSNWIETVRRSPGPYFFVAETVLIYLQQQEVKTALARIADCFPDMSVAFDTATHRAIIHGNRDFVRRKMDARFTWACDHPKEIEEWNIGLRLVESLGFTDVPDPLRSRLSAPARARILLLNKLPPKIKYVYRLNLFSGTPKLDG
ncbi:MAG TPA: class I SAM-dependent methyltransferase [Bryobacteraceae bacterium]|nr:class I SAM-dependent methyltransferase [Bryobacteraceae bacterium]